MADEFDKWFDTPANKAPRDEIGDWFSSKKPANRPAALALNLPPVRDRFAPSALIQQELGPKVEAVNTFDPATGNVGTAILPGSFNAARAVMERQQRARAQAEAEAAAFEQAAADNPATMMDVGRAYSVSVLGALGGAANFAGRIYTRAQDGLASLFGLPNGIDFSQIGAPLMSAADTVRGGYNEGFVKELANNEWGVETDADGNPVGSEWNPRNWTLGKDPSLMGFAGNTANVAGSVIPVIGASFLTGGVGAPAVLGGAIGGGAATDSIEQDIDRMWADGRMSESQAYVDLVRGGMDPYAAYQQVRQQAADLGGVGAAALAAAGGALTGKLMNPATNLFPRLARPIGVPLTAGAASLAEGAQEGAEQVATNAGQNIGAGTEIPLDRGVAGNVIGGLIGGLGEGGVAAFHAAQNDPAVARAYRTAMNDAAPLAERMAALMDLNARGYSVPEAAIKPADQNAEPYDSRQDARRAATAGHPSDFNSAQTATELNMRGARPAPITPDNALDGVLPVSEPAAGEQQTVLLAEQNIRLGENAHQTPKMPAPRLVPNMAPAADLEDLAPAQAPAQAPQSAADLFAAPTQAERIRAAEEQKSAQRDGKTGSAPVPGWSGTALGAGAAPAQADIEDFGGGWGAPDVDREQVIADNATAAMELGLDADGHPAPEPTFEYPERFEADTNRKWGSRQVIGKDGRRHTIPAPEIDYARDHFLHWLAGAGGVNANAVADVVSQSHKAPRTKSGKVKTNKDGTPWVNLDFIGTKDNRPYGKADITAIRRVGGMDLRTLWENMREDGWFVDDAGDGNSGRENDSAYTSGENDAADMVYRAIRGETIFHPTRGVDERIALDEISRYEQDVAAAEQAWREREHDLGDLAEIRRRLRDEYQSAIDEADGQEAASLAELVQRARAAGATAEQTKELDGEQPAAHAARLWQLINNQENSRGADARATQAGDRSGEQGVGRRAPAGEAGAEQPAATAVAGSANGRGDPQAGAADAEVTGKGESRTATSVPTTGSAPSRIAELDEQADEEIDDELDDDLEDIDALRRPGQKKKKRSKRKGSLITSTRADVTYTAEDNVFLENGYTEDEIANMTPRQQVVAATRVWQDRFGFKSVEVSNDLNTIEALTQLRFGYRNLQSLAYILAWPEQTFGKIVPNIGLARTAQGALAYYSPSQQKIVLSRQHDVFAHEFGHGIDWWVWNTMKLVDPNTGEPRGRAATGKLRMGGELTNRPIEAAFENLLSAMYKGHGDAAYKIASLEKHIEVINQQIAKKQAKAATTTSDEARAKLEDQIKKHQEHVGRLVKQIHQIAAAQAASYSADTQYYLNSRMLDRANASESADGGYWQRPTEMFARAFEAWVADRIEATGATTEFLSREDAGYLDTSRDFISKAYPQLLERETIFAAIDDLMNAVRDEAIKGVQGPLASLQLPPAYSGLHLTANAEIKPLKLVAAIRHSMAVARSSTAREKEADRRAAMPLAAARAARNTGNSPASRMLHDTWLRATDATLDFTKGWGATVSGWMHSMEDRYPRSGTVRELSRIFTTDPGTGKVRAQTYEEYSVTKRAFFGNMLGRIINEFDLLNDKEWSPDERRMLRDSLVDHREGGARPNYPSKILQASRKLREFHDRVFVLVQDEFNKKRAAGEEMPDIGYVKDGYLKRIVDKELVRTDPAGFVDKAAEVYREVFDGEVSSRDNPSVDKLIAAGEQVLPGGRANPDLRELRTLARKLADARNNDDQDKADELEQQILDLLDGGLYDAIRDAWAREAAHDWKNRVLGTAPAAHIGVQTAGGSFMKSRALPPSADITLGDYMVTDPVELASTYMTEAINRATFERFIPGTGPGATRLEEYRARLTADGLADKDIEHMMQVLKTLTGIYRPNFDTSFIRDTVQSYYLPVMLARSLFSQLAEPTTLALRTGNVFDAGRVYASQMRDLASWLPGISRMVPRGASARAEWAAEMAEYFGAVTNAHFDEVVNNRLNMMSGSRQGTRKIANFMKYNGIHPHAMSMRRAAVERSFVYFARIARKALDGSEQAKRDLADLGVDFNTDKKLVKYLADTLRVGMDRQSIEDSGHRDKLWVMVNRFVDETIMNPKKADKPRAASSEMGYIYNILSFTAAFQNNVVKRQGKRLARAFARDGFNAGSIQAANAAMAFGVFISFQAAQYFLRLLAIGALTGHGDDDLEKAIKQFAEHPVLASMNIISRSGVTGMLDPVVNAFMGLKYRRQLSSFMTGAYLSMPLSAIEKAGNLAFNNSDKTNKAEHGAVEAAWNAVLMPMVAHVMLTRAPFLIPIMAPLSSNNTADAVADLAVGPDKEKSDMTADNSHNRKRDNRRNRERKSTGRDE